MQAGELRELLTIQAPVETRDSIGGVEIVWRDEGQPVWGCVKALTPRELLEAQKIEARLSHKIILRLPATLTEKKRLALAPTPWTGNVLRIFQVYGTPELDDHHRVMMVYAMEVR